MSSDRIQWTNASRKLGELVPWPRNPRQIKTDQAKRLAQSFDEFGQVETIAIGPGNEVYNGHQRLNVLMDKHGGDYEVEVRVASRPLTEKEREKLTVYLHKGAAGEWDFDTLANEFELDELLEWGFDKKELDLDLWAGEPAEDPGAQVDKAEELREKWGVESGQLWRLGEHRLICGDCTDKATVERVMGGERADITFTSPPYNVSDNAKLSPHQSNGSKYVDYSDSMTDDEYLSLLYTFTRNTLEHCEYSFVNVQSLAGNKLVLIDLLNNLKDVYADTLIWDKMNAQPAMAENVLNSQFEYIHVFSNRATRNIGTQPFRGTISNVVQIHKKASEIKEHNATFSVELAEFFVGKFSTTMVIDPFLGSGTTLIACERLGRKCRAVEISPAYCAVAIQRWVDMTGGVPEMIG